MVGCLDGADGGCWEAISGVGGMVFFGSLDGVGGWWGLLPCGGGGFFCNAGCWGVRR